ncbi:MAG: PorP/SprF family type IX secretion system membrane protein [Lentimicrobiaceae bacterium]|nr:PorP/SprF family type IX secretion system membrane protein [Lentimicrobiaceae bacterium]
MILCKRKFCFLFIFIALTFTNVLGQEAHFSQFYANPLYMNPAFAGTMNCPRFSLNFRDQYPSIPGNFLTFSGSYDQHFHKIRSGIGLLVSADIAGGGIMSSYNIGAIYNFRVKITHNFNLQLALQGGYLSNALNWNKLKFASELIEMFPHTYSFEDQLKKSQFDAAFGFVGYTPFLYFGFAMHHLFPVQISFIRSSNDKFKTEWIPKLTAHIGGKITIQQKVKRENNFGDIFLHPNIIFISQGDFHYLHEGFYFNFYPFTIGTWLRHNFKSLDALIVTCGIEYKFLRIGYSYDFTLTQLVRTGGAHEVSLQFIIPCENDQNVSPKKKKKNYSSIDCPLF